jgi:hypothetical protein
MLKHNPETKIIIGSYNQTLANRFSRLVRAALAEDFATETQRRGENGKFKQDVQEKQDTQNLKYPADPVHPVNISAPRLGDSAANSLWPIRIRSKNSEAEWETAEGGGVRAVGVGGGVTGYGAHLVIIDDPVKSRAEAESETMREKVWNWFNDDIYTRLEPDGKIILIQTRWHEDDLAGRLLREAAEEGGEQWEVISLPALAEGNFAAETQRKFKQDGQDGQDLMNRQCRSNSNHPVDPVHPVNLPSLRLCASAVKTSVESEFNEFKDWLKRTWPNMKWEFRHQLPRRRQTR